MVQSLRENISLSKMSCFVVQTSALGLKKKKKKCPFLLLENSRPLSPSWEPQTPFSSSGIPGFLTTYLGIDSFTKTPVRYHIKLFKLATVRKSGITQYSWNGETVMNDRRVTAGVGILESNPALPCKTDKIQVQDGYRSKILIAPQRLVQSIAFGGKGRGLPWWLSG